MPITNLAIQRRRLKELTHILGRAGWYIEPMHLDKYDGFSFQVRTLDVELVKHLKEADFDLMTTTLNGDFLRVYVTSKTPEKDGCKKIRDIP